MRGENWVKTDMVVTTYLSDGHLPAMILHLTGLSPWRAAGQKAKSPPEAGEDAMSTRFLSGGLRWRNPAKLYLTSTTGKSRNSLMIADKSPSKNSKKTDVFPKSSPAFCF